MKKKDKVYCGECQFFDNEFCEINPKRTKAFYYAPNYYTTARELCAVKNSNNRCRDSKKRRS